MTYDPMGSTALVTGASSGIGREFALRLAERGADLVLVARREERLTALAAELATKYGTSSTVVALDLTRPDAVPTLAARLAADGIRLSTLVNNAGFGNYDSFDQIDPQRVAEEVALDVAAVVALTRAFLPELLEAGIGALVNVASTAAFQPMPRMAVYGASKAFVLSFTEALWYETKGSGLKVLALCPGPTSTEFVDVAKNEDVMFGPMQSAGEVVAAAMRQLDRRNPGPAVISGGLNRFFAKTVRFVPRRLLLDTVGRVGAPKKR